MADARIARVWAREVWDSRGHPTIEVDVASETAVGRAIAPAGASTGSGEATELRDGGRRLGGRGVRRAVGQVNRIVDPALRGMDPSDQEAVDERLIELDGTTDRRHLGANAMIAVSLATAWSAAGARPLWRHLAADGPLTLPMPEIQIIGGGAHAGRRIDIQDLMVVPLAASSLTQALEWAAEVYRAMRTLLVDRAAVAGVADEGGWWPAFARNEEALAALTHAIEAAGLEPGRDVAISLDVAATQFRHRGLYRLACDDAELDSDGLCELLVGWVQRYPICSVEDPLGEDDHVGMAAFTKAVGDRVQVVGDDLVTTSAERIRRAAASKSVNAVLIKPNQVGTLSEARAAFEAARHASLDTIVSARSGETEDVSISHLAVGWGADQLKVGSIARGERTAKWNELVRIEEELGARQLHRTVVSPQEVIGDG